MHSLYLLPYTSIITSHIDLYITPYNLNLCRSHITDHWHYSLIFPYFNSPLPLYLSIQPIYCCSLFPLWICVFDNLVSLSPTLCILVSLIMMAFWKKWFLPRVSTSLKLTALTRLLPGCNVRACETNLHRSKFSLDLFIINVRFNSGSILFHTNFIILLHISYAYDIKIHSSFVFFKTLKIIIELFVEGINICQVHFLQVFGVLKFFKNSILILFCSHVQKKMPTTPWG